HTGAGRQAARRPRATSRHRAARHPVCRTYRRSGIMTFSVADEARRVLTTSRERGVWDEEPMLFVYTEVDGELRGAISLLHGAHPAEIMRRLSLEAISKPKEHESIVAGKLLGL